MANPLARPVARTAMARAAGFDPDCPTYRHWQSLVDRRLIGNIPPMDPAVAERILAAEAIVCPRRRAGAVW